MHYQVTALGRQIRTARKEAGFSNAEQLAVPLGVGVRTVQRWEQGKSTPSIVQLLKIAELTKRPLAFFLVDEEAAVA